MNFSELEAAAGKLLEEKKRLNAIEGELGQTERDLREQPRRTEKDRKFFALIGLDWAEPAQLRQRNDDLKNERESIERSIRESYDVILKGFSSDDLVVPLDPTPLTEGKVYSFRYRSNAAYPNLLQELSELLGLPIPLRLDKVSVMPDRIEVAEVDAYFAKERIVEAFETIRKTVSLKLSPRSSQPSY